MFFTDKPDHSMISIYGDTQGQNLARALWSVAPDKDIKLLTPNSRETLHQAAQNSVLVLIHIQGADDKNLEIAAELAENRLIVADIVACYDDQTALDYMEILGRGFDQCLKYEDFSHPDFKAYILSKIRRGSRRLDGLILEEDYKRFSDALSNAPASLMVFDNDKRAVFISDHYFRTYPKIVGKLVRGLSAYDAYELMMREEGADPDDPKWRHVREFWYHLDGNMEFSIDGHHYYRVKASRLPGNRGTVVTGQNISDYIRQKRELEEKSIQLKKSLDKARETSGGQNELISLLKNEFKYPVKDIEKAIEFLKKVTESNTDPRTKQARHDLDQALRNLKETIEDLLS